MKKILIIACLFLSINLFSQGNLQFNQVLLFSANTSSGGNQVTVPAGKVWKIESYFISNNVSLQIIINNIPYYVNTQSFPFWVPSGTTFNMFVSGISGSATVSIIEFNVVP
jgi:hypothetical protein